MLGGNTEYIQRNTKWRMAIKEKRLGREFTDIACLVEILVCMCVGPTTVPKVMGLYF